MKGRGLVRVVLLSERMQVTEDIMERDRGKKWKPGTSEPLQQRPVVSHVCVEPCAHVQVTHIPQKQRQKFHWGPGRWECPMCLLTAL